MKKLIVFIAVMMWLGLGSFFRQLRPGDGRALAAENEQAAQEILRSTVRLHLQAWRVKEDESGYFLDESIGHATLKDGRYLVTHNHYSLLEPEDLLGGAISVAIFNSAGRYLFSAPLTDFNVALAGPETRVLEMKYDFMRERLAASGVTSAQFAQPQSLDLRPGMPVAQVDWDGQVTRIDWTTIETAVTAQGVPRLVLNDGVSQGGSGGGVYWNGLHIANNWQSVEHLDGNGAVIYVTSVASLNPQ